MRHSSLTATALITVLAVGLLSGCASPPKVAQKKVVNVAGHKLEFGGEYDTRRKALTLSVNGDPVMSGSFPPYTPTLQLKSQYQSLEVAAECYFGSVLSSRGGVVGIVAGAVQAGQGKSGDKCDVLVGGKVVEALYF